MADKVKAARAGDLIIHTSVWAEILSVVAQGVIYAAATAALVAAAPCTLVAAVGATAVAVGAGLMLGAATSLIPVGSKSITEHISDGCDAVANLIFPPEPAGAIASGSDDTAVNALPAARAAGYQISDVPDAEPVKPGVLETLGALVVGLTPYGWYQAVDTIINPPVVTQPNPTPERSLPNRTKWPAPGTRPCPCNTSLKAHGKSSSTANRLRGTANGPPVKVRLTRTSTYPRMCALAGSRWWYAKSAAARTSWG